MTATFPRPALRAALATLCKVVERRNTFPVCAMVRISECNGAVRLEGTDLDHYVLVTIPGADAPPGFVVLVPAHTLKDTERKAPAGDLISVSASGVVTVGALAMQLPTASPSDWPDAFNVGEPRAEFAILTPDLQRAINATSFAISSEETRYYLNGIFLHPAPEGTGALRFVATDGHRLAHHDIPGNHAADAWSGIVARKTVNLIALATKGRGAPAGAVITMHHRHVRIEAGPCVITSKLIDGTFPDYGRVIPRHNPHAVTVNSEALASAVSAVLASSEDKRASAVSLEIEDGALTVVRTYEGRTSEIRVPCDYDGEPLHIGFNGRYILDILDAAACESVTFRLSDPGAPAFVSADESSFFVLMPMRVAPRERQPVAAPALAPEMPADVVADTTEADAAPVICEAPEVAEAATCPADPQREAVAPVGAVAVLERPAMASAGGTPSDGGKGAASPHGERLARPSLGSMPSSPPVEPVSARTPSGPVSGAPPVEPVTSLPPVEPMSTARQRAQDDAMAKLREIRASYIPRGAVMVADKLSDAVAYLFQAANGMPAALVFVGRQHKPARRYRYRSEAQRERDVREAFEARRAITKGREERKASPNPYKVGDILKSLWGYEQTNVDFYEVVKVAGQFVEVRKLARESIETSWCQGEAVPLPGDYAGGELRRRVGPYGIRIDDVRLATLAETQEVGGVRVVKPAHYTSYG